MPRISLMVKIIVIMISGIQAFGDTPPPVSNCQNKPPSSCSLKGFVPGSCIPVVAYYGVPAAYTSIERYREMAECGFTHATSAGGLTIEQADAAIGTAAKTGIKLIISSPTIIEKDPEIIARRYCNHPALGGYFLKDEPSASDFGRLSQLVKRIEAVDKNHLCYINLFPNYANATQLGTETYQQHIDQFLTEVPVKLLSFDHYPIADYQVRPLWYKNLEIIAEAARKKNIPFGAFALVSTHYAFTPATLSQLRLQMYSNLAYGAQYLQYFPYWAPNKAHLETCIKQDGTRGQMYERVKQMNHEIHGLSNVFLGSRVVKLGHTGSKTQWDYIGKANPGAAQEKEGPIPEGTQSYKPCSPVAKLVTRGKDGAIVSHLERGNRQFLVIVNKDYAHIMLLDVEFDDSNVVYRVEKQGLPIKVSDQKFKTQVAPGDVVIFTWLKETGSEITNDR